MERLIVPIYLSSSTLHADSATQENGKYLVIDRTEISIAEPIVFAEAIDFVSQAERDDGGEEYSFGCGKKFGWKWPRPFGS